MKKIFYFIGLIFKGIWKLITFIRVALTNLLFLAAIAMLYFTFASQDGNDTVKSEPQQASALVLNLSGPIVEQRSYIKPVDSLSGNLLGNDLPKENVVYEVVETLRHAASDDSISGLVLDLKQMPETSLTKLRYIAKAISEFRASGKPVYAQSDFYNQSQYYLASYANKIFLSPDGAVLLKGYAAYNLYFKDLLEKLDINTHVFRVGTYKSAIEPFIRNDMSDAARESATTWLSQLWNAYSHDVATNRGIEQQALNPDMEHFLAQLKQVDGNLAQLSKDIGLVDELATRQQVRQALITQFGAKGKDSYRAIDYYRYQKQITPTMNNTNDEIAVIVASGTIMDGKQPRGRVGGDSTAALLRQARTDSNVKAVVLRVDSPGGSAFASEIIRNEVEALKQAGKPVVVSMSSLAASGGYWISMSADKIIAQPTTLTGSIGIFGVITTFEKGLNKLGVHTDGVGTSPFSADGVTNGLSEGAQQAMQMGIEHGYHRFISLVAQNRNSSPEKIDQVAQGRVWTGQDALEHGLVDQLGDFDDALDTAAQLANLTSYQLDWMEKPLTPVQQIIQDLFGSLDAKMAQSLSAVIPQAWLPMGEQAIQATQLLNSFNDPKGYYAFCLNCSAY